jgi:hypothetical protein
MLRQFFFSVAMVGLHLVLGGSSAQAALPKRALELKDALAQPIRFPGVEDQKAPLTEVLEILVKLAGVNKANPLAFAVNEKAFQAEGLTDVSKTEVAAESPLPPMNASLAAVLNKVLSRIPVDSGATYVVRPDAIEITTQAAVLKEFYAPGTRERRYPLVVASFENKPLDDALKELAQQTGKNVILDLRTGKEGRTPITGDFMNVPLDNAVFLLADMANLATVRLNPTTLYVTTARNAQAIEKRQQQEQKANAMGDVE